MSGAMKSSTSVRAATLAAAQAADDPVDPSITRFLDAVWMERGLSPNTLAAYRADLTALARWLKVRGVDVTRTARNDLLGFIAWRVETGARPRSTARQLSSFRRFFRWAVREGVLAEDPTAQIAMPKIGRSLPKSLTEAEVDSCSARRRSPTRSGIATARCSRCSMRRACACPNSINLRYSRST
jgi:integrase/recombinase XerD